MKAVLLDRDGVINPLIYHQDAGIVDAPFVLEQFKLFPRVPSAIRYFNRLNLKVAIVSNQPGIAKGHLQYETLKRFDETMLSAISAEGGQIEGIYYCLHHPQAKIAKYRKRCGCRKPATGLLRRAASDMGVSTAECYMIGDGISDLLAGTRAGCRTVFIGRWKCEICQFTECPEIRPSLVARDLWHACQLIAKEMKSEGAAVKNAAHHAARRRKRKSVRPG